MWRLSTVRWALRPGIRVRQGQSWPAGKAAVTLTHDRREGPRPNPTKHNPLCPITHPKCTPLTPSHASLRFRPTHAAWSSPAVLCRATLSPSAPAQSGAHAAVLWTIYATRTIERLTEHGPAPESPFNGTYIPEHRAAECRQPIAISEILLHPEIVTGTGRRLWVVVPSPNRP